MCAGRSLGSIPPLPLSVEKDTAATANTAETSSGGSGMSGGNGSLSSPRKGLLVEVMGEAALFSTKVCSSSASILRFPAFVLFMVLGKCLRRMCHGRVLLSDMESRGSGHSRRGEPKNSNKGLHVVVATCRK